MRYILISEILKYENSISFKVNVTWDYNQAYTVREEGNLTLPRDQGRLSAKEMFLFKFENNKIMTMTTVTVTANVW